MMPHPNLDQSGPPPVEHHIPAGESATFDLGNGRYVFVTQLGGKVGGILKVSSGREMVISPRAHNEFLISTR